jgi:hypothetical protein
MGVQWALPPAGALRLGGAGGFAPAGARGVPAFSFFSPRGPQAQQNTYDWMSDLLTLEIAYTYDKMHLVTQPKYCQRIYPLQSRSLPVSDAFSLTYLLETPDIINAPTRRCENGRPI